MPFLLLFNVIAALWIGSPAGASGLPVPTVEQCARLLAPTRFSMASVEALLAELDGAAADPAAVGHILERLPTAVFEKRGSVLRIDGRRVHHIRLNGGFNNDGVYFFRTRNGANRALKVLLRPSSEDRILPVRQLLHQARGYYLGERVGGPKVKRIGRVSDPRSTSPEPALFIELEELFPGQNKTPFMDILESRPDLWLKKVPGSRFSVVEAAVEKVFDAYERGILPVDADFLVTDTGQLRWVDAAMWKEKGNIARDISILGFDLSKFLGVLHYHGRKAPELASQAGRAMILRILERTKSSPAFTFDQKLALIDHAFGAHDAQLLYDFEIGPAPSDSPFRNQASLYVRRLLEVMLGRPSY